ncbi:unnamed protein product, partial [Ectocarpus sp. 12 AP-2014]
MVLVRTSFVHILNATHSGIQCGQTRNQSSVMRRLLTSASSNFFSDRSGTSDNCSVHGKTELVEKGRASEDEVTNTRPCVGMNAEDSEDGESSKR